ncbi:RNA-directed DNA polymerase, eukaryota [Artemisia annua]|uniref:RNA-directed DNA polymerase, eukaryota n=1 Tax=Artemisia annua TaxID=35608 RepID=A0A2U1PL91_ARTAN|nr:RNA-directed DNA polymerase, eukaryota [Artemisia annua]
MGNSGVTYANVIQGQHKMNSEPVVVLDEGCLKDLDASLTVFACVKEFRSLTNMRSICKNEGFHNVKLKYLGGFWISVEFQAIETCMKFQKHAGVQSWFSSIVKPTKEFHIRERVAWIDVEGIPVQAWTHQTFKKIASKWGELIYTVDSTGTNMYSARLCIKTTVETLIVDSFKVDVRGYVSMVRAKEITGWTMEFLEDSSSMEVDDKRDMEVPNDIDSQVEDKIWGDNDEERVEDSYCRAPKNQECLDEMVSEDPFELNDLIKKTTANRGEEDSCDPVFPPGFTPIQERKNELEEDLSGKQTQYDDGVSVNNNLGEPGKFSDEREFVSKEVRDKDISNDGRRNDVFEKQCERNCDGIGREKLPDVGSTPDMVGESQSLNNDSVTKPRIVIDGFSMIDKFNEVIDFGHAMGFDMKGCAKDMKRIIASMGGNIGIGRKAKKKWVRELCVKHGVKFLAIQETKKASMSCVAVRSLWGNSFFDCSVASSIGRSGGILCVWDKGSFIKEREIICSNFVALEGTWVSSNTKVLIVSVYAPQEFDAKKVLWDQLSSMIRVWSGEVILMGDFNEVRWEHERFGSVFNRVQANHFNDFISQVELVDVPLGGYMFTWSDSSASKMSKIDRLKVWNKSKVDERYNSKKMWQAKLEEIDKRVDDGQGVALAGMASESSAKEDAKVYLGGLVFFSLVARVGP